MQEAGSGSGIVKSFVNMRHTTPFNVARSNDASQIQGRAASEVQVPPATNSGQQVEAAVQLNDTKVAIANDAS